MSRFTSLFSSGFLGSAVSAQSRTTDGLTRLRFTLETLPGSKKYVFTQGTRTEILSELYNTFWGSHIHSFLPESMSSMQPQVLLSEVQARYSLNGSGSAETITPGRCCSHIFTKGESCYRCKDCALDDSCVLCARCFHATNHEGHNVTFYIAQQSGSCCDCGDPEAWRVPIGCRYHPPLNDSTHTPTQSTPKASYRKLDSPSIPPPQMDRSSVPLDLLDSMTRSISYALEFIIDTLDYSPEECNVPENEEALLGQPSQDPTEKDLFAIVLWNDEKHAFSEVNRQLVETCGCTLEEAVTHTDRMDEEGRGVVELGSCNSRLLEIAHGLEKVDLGVTVRRAYDTFREQISAVLIEWLHDLSRCRLRNNTTVIREIIAAELFSRRKKDVNLGRANPDFAEAIAEIPDPSKLEWLFLYHTRLWKKPRMDLKEIYVSLLTLSHDHKLTVAENYANVYRFIVDSYLLVDREAETSIKYLALQLFTVPSVAAHIVKEHKIVSKLLSIITAFFTNQIRNKRVVYPPLPINELDVDAFPFKSKRFMPIFSDLRYICHNETVQRLIAHDPEYMEQFARTCRMFMCINPNKRAAAHHVEYENEGWISVFNVTLSLSRVIKVYGEAFSNASPPELVHAISCVVENILLVCSLRDGRLDKAKFPPVTFHDQTFANKTMRVVNFSTMDGWVSFHHSLHWLLAELLKHIDLLNADSLERHGLPTLREIVRRNENDDAMLAIIDYPLRVLAMVAQIRTGLWVRNGFVIRGQLLHYRDFMLRELCYDQDLFVMQAAFVVLEDPDVVIASIIDRFQLSEWFRGDMNSAVYEGTQLYSMVEEILYIFITVLSENANASRMAVAKCVRREIVHALAVGACTYTDLVKRVAERLVDHVSFDVVLKEITNFRPPESTADTGVYELKDEYFEEVNPFFYHYTRNRREEVDSILKTRLRKKTGVTDPVIVPKSLGITSGPFHVLSSVFDSRVLMQVVFYCIDNIIVYTDALDKTPPSCEAILDQSLHLVMLGLVERGFEYAKLSATMMFGSGKNLIDVLCTLEHHKVHKAYRARVDWILQRIASHFPSEVQSKRRIPSKPASSDTEEAKKRAAQARKAAIMKQMKAQQTSFALNLDNVDDEDEMDGRGAESVSFGTCIVCQEDLDSSKGFGALAMVQPSRLIRKHPDGSSFYLNEAILTDSSLDRNSSKLPDASFPPKDAEAHDAAKRASGSTFDGFPPHTKFGLYTSVCSHMMHLDCFQVYNASIKHRHRAQGQRNHPESIARKEYICPLCKSLGNVVLPVSLPADTPLNIMPFSDWVRSVGITILKSRPDPQLDALQSKTGTGEFVFWAAQDSGYIPFAKSSGESLDWHKMLDTLVVITKSLSQQTRHLRERLEPEPSDRGAGLYLPEDLVGYTIGAVEIAHRGSGEKGKLIVDKLTDPTFGMIRGLVSNLTRLAAMHFSNRPDEGRDAIRQAIIKRLLPEWSRTSMTSLPYPLLLRDPLTILVETAAVSPEMLRHALIPLYYACLARTVIGLVYVLNKTRAINTVSVPGRRYESIFGDIRIFCMSVVRQSPVIEHTAEVVLDAYGDARIEKLIYTLTLPFLRRAAILCRAMLPGAFPSPNFGPDEPDEYGRLLTMLGIPKLVDLPNQDTLKTLLYGWCSHYGQSHAASQLNCGVVLEYSSIYRIAELPLVLDSIFADEDKLLVCKRCKTSPADAAVCLICGTLVCMQSHCCRDTDIRERGECNLHTRECGGAIGVYFLVKRCSLLYLYAGNGAFVQAPYLDVHGEVDMSMRRGRRQYLHGLRWEELRKNWLQHGIPTLIARKLESTVDSGGWESL